MLFLEALGKNQFLDSSSFLGLLTWASLVPQLVKNLPAMEETWIRFLDWEDPSGGGHGNPLQYSCLENPHEQRSLAGYSPWSREESDATERCNTAHSKEGKGSFCHSGNRGCGIVKNWIDSGYILKKEQR